MLNSPEYDDARLAVLLERARQRSRALRRRQRLRRCLGGAAALALVAALAGGLAAARAPGQQIQTAAYITRVERALTSRGQDMVEYDRTVLPPGSGVRATLGGWEDWMATPRAGVRSSQGTGLVAVEWTHQVSMALLVVTTTGQPVLATQITVAAGSMRQVTVDYRARTWWRATIPLPPGAQNPAPGGCGPGEGLGTGGWPAFIRYELSCGEFQTAGRQRVDGIDAVKLTGSGGLVLWIDPATYLPVRQVVGGGRPPTDFHWRPATAANLAQMRVAVPAGFGQVPPPPPARIHLRRA